MTVLFLPDDDQHGCNFRVGEDPGVEKFLVYARALQGNSGDNRQPQAGVVDYYVGDLQAKKVF